MLILHPSCQTTTLKCNAMILLSYPTCSEKCYFLWKIPFKQPTSLCEPFHRSWISAPSSKCSGGLAIHLWIKQSPTTTWKNTHRLFTALCNTEPGKNQLKKKQPMTQRNIQGQATPGGGEKRWEVPRSGLNDTAKRSPPARPPPSFISRRSLQWAPASGSLPLHAAERLGSAFQSRI